MPGVGSSKNTSVVEEDSSPPSPEGAKSPTAGKEVRPSTPFLQRRELSDPVSAAPECPGLGGAAGLGDSDQQCGGAICCLRGKALRTSPPNANSKPQPKVILA
eukprot:CAMPEP_0173386338 /NCGR_PEP_ID=MMETSP1356-20130122/8935_1 /TAXON_ID=77927 ORGANISM="Hemiselmis virescens, Strain PCC157" /NCGR_SAMPLE_ID=MMETSP1356 /ASSEMBLY_ACC=CAM_ASM_000847 /LENGTH=102 /DNA_ID=CAMNT_0014342527 /DNA_START=369 /DNA_END=677 /DNA_ORIENTATION=+